MNFTTRDLQARINALYNSKVLDVDGISGPMTRNYTQLAMNLRGVKTPRELFGDEGLHRIHWHWTASGYKVTYDVARHYNDVFDEKGNQYDGGARPEHQAAYSVARKIGVSHTLNANTGAIGLAVAAMRGAEGWPSLMWGDSPLTWPGIDAMLVQTAEYCKEFDIPVSRWSTLSHAEIEPTLGITQRAKWDFRVLPGYPSVMDAQEVGDILRQRLVDKFLC